MNGYFKDRACNPWIISHSLLWLSKLLKRLLKGATSIVEECSLNIW